MVVKYLVCQVCPIPREPVMNMERYEAYISSNIPNVGKDTWMIVLPEMAFTGYVFSSYEDVYPYTEEKGNGITYEWCSRIAKMYGVYVFCGFPERAGNKLYNSMMCVGIDGTLVHIYCKHYLFSCDELWATAGDGFSHIHLYDVQCKSIGNVGLGICMDINTPGFSNWHMKYHPSTMYMANYMKKHKCKIVILIANVPTAPKRSIDTYQPYMQRTHWVRRLLPLHGTDTTLCVANRVGTDESYTFVGSSCIVHLNRCKVLAEADCNSEMVIHA